MGVTPRDTPGGPSLPYRYLFFDWLFRDASRGSRPERAAAWRHNRAQARWLPVYLRRWAGAGLTLCAMGVVVESALGAPAWSMLFYVPGALALPVNTVIAAAWLGLKVLPGPG